MRILLFDTDTHGHHLEYLHHLYDGLGCLPHVELIFAVPHSFEEEKTMYEWDERVKVCVVHIPEEDILRTKRSGILRNSWQSARLLRKYVNEYKPDAVFLIMLMAFMPFLPFLISRRIKVYGIIYKIYLYRWHQISRIRKIMEVCNFLLMRYCKNILSVYILNDRSAARYLCRLYHTDKFRYLPDPFNEISYKGRDVRHENGIDPSDVVFLHFGALSDRKGTIEIMDAISLLSPDEARDKTFVFAGLIDKNIKKCFYDKYEHLKTKYKIFVFDEFCTNEQLADLCVSCDYILCPYVSDNLSSGIFGYAAYYNKKLIGPSSGLMGKLIRKYKLGMTLPTINKETLYDSISHSDRSRIIVSKYISEHTIKSFSTIVSDDFSGEF